MGHAADQFAPRTRQTDVAIRELPDELLVYDTRRHEAHTLNPIAAAIWKRCDGNTTVARIAAAVGDAGIAVTEETVWQVLRELEGKHLLNDSLPDVSRRRALAAAAAATAVFALPFVTSIVAPTAAEAQTIG